MKRVIGSLVCQTSLAEVCIEANTKHRLGGVDFDAATRMPTSLTWYDWIGPRIKCLDDTTAPTIITDLPTGEGVKYAFVKWSARGDKLAVTVKGVTGQSNSSCPCLPTADTTNSSISVYIIDALTGQANRIGEGLRLNAVTGACPYLWSTDGEQLLLWCVPDANMKDIDSKMDRLFSPPEGPVTQECHGKKQEARTYANTLKSSHDDMLFEYYTTTQMHLHTVSSGETKPLGGPAMITDTSFSPDGRFLLLTEITGPPFSRE
ncbi:hypothetical protein Pmar_PMAR005414 [Perkinsus marinus ATCC 50983]|uniref:Acylamino-acid-releasing enzyme n=1 Tax=Perkinsus marinus (strain ATCC 50983 / TXsc) TaxID=423536 RepID=C5KBE4_PERM5|nr:hypothetical protein Pmar_PMAR005414 [Perkinsus marinus ATCC 50983]EER18470.1 hypothetical protein Pmar_PMAR005414 [Perkinsus marinus ATCC 50983]|eukprot:XP_002786674.1 hypothetical protein Pmar_PMAR005414 [Perkinsus marinus ATCC 50983]